jgi:hypothetical protein
MMSKAVFPRIILLACVLLSIGIPVFGQDLTISPDDLRIELRADGGYHLFIRTKPNISSVLLTESTRDPVMAADNYAYRVLEWNPVNGDEIRLLNGYPIPRESGIFSLIDSSPEPHPELGSAFHIYIPWVVYYGYENERYGEVHINDGAYVNIRAFNLPYADYRGRFADNPFVFRAVQQPPEKPDGKYLPEAETAFNEIAKQGRGDFVYAPNPPALVEVIKDLLKKEAGKTVDIVLCLDTTGSMTPYIDELRKMLISMMKEYINGFNDWQIGMVLFKDYHEEYITRVNPFTRDFDLFQKNLNAIRVRGGGDIPEAVYEALYDGADKFPWTAESRLLILVGDAPPHPKPRGNITREMVFQKAEEKGLKISAILLSR